MIIKYYKSIICPRCIPTNRFLKSIREKFPEIVIEEIEVLKNMKAAKKDGIGSIPSIIIGNRVYRGVPPEDEFISLIQSSSN
ncbi:MAG: hypothetical protein DRG20_04270 [Deltaproteobacteria bacterium]|nr:MAG: hypothetical protein DRG20_04270 [Deltaproteobacteria bacterium]